VTRIETFDAAKTHSLFQCRVRLQPDRDPFCRTMIWRLTCKPLSQAQEVAAMRRVLSRSAGWAFGLAGSGLIAFAVNVAAQQYPPAQSAAAPPSATHQPTRVVTVEGCLVKEEDVPGRKPTVVERAGLAEDFILMNAKVIKGNPDTPVGTSGANTTMYEVKGFGAEQLKAHVGLRVQIDGSFAKPEQPSDSAQPRNPAENLMEIRGTAIRPATGDCPPSK
jgi:hypothetical protein